MNCSATTGHPVVERVKSAALFDLRRVKIYRDILSSLRCLRLRIMFLFAAISVHRDTAGVAAIQTEANRFATPSKQNSKSEK
jgi:hypothetical protein